MQEVFLSAFSVQVYRGLYCSPSKNLPLRFFGEPSRRQANKTGSQWLGQKLGLWRRSVNRMIRVMLRLGVSPPHTHLLTVRGRKSGYPHSTPVTLVEGARKRWLVAPYGEVGWVRNARAAEQVTLTRGRRFETVRIQELSARTPLRC